MKKHCDLQIKQLQKELNHFQNTLQQILQDIPILLSVCRVCQMEQECIDLPCQHSICRDCYERVKGQCSICPSVVRNESFSSDEMI